ncbi:unnamed protein product [Chrysoparadoxa australica]
MAPRGRGFRGRGRGRGGGSGGGGRGMHGHIPQEKFEYNVCKFFVQGTCTHGANCHHDHIVSQLAEVSVASNRTSVNGIAQWGGEAKVLTCSGDGRVSLYSSQDGETWNMGVQVEFHNRLPVAAILEADNFLFCGYEGPYVHAVPPHGSRTPAVTVGMLRVLNLGGGAEVEVVIDADKAPYAHPQRVNCLCLGSVSGAPILFSGGEEGTIRLWEAQGADFRLVKTLEGHVRGITALVFTGNRLWSASKDTTIRVWDIGTATCVGVIAGAAGVGHGNEITSMAGPIKQEGDQTEYIVSGSLDQSIRVWDTLSGEKVHELNCHANITALACVESPVGPLVLLGMDDGTIAVRDFPGFSLAFELNSAIFRVGHRMSPVQTVVPLRIEGPLGKVYFMSGADDGKLICWCMHLAP